MIRTNRFLTLMGSLAGIGLLFATSQAQAAELLVTPVEAKGGGVRVALDVASDGDVSGFNFTVNLGKGAARSADLSQCVADLPKGFTGECRLTNGKVIVFAMADRMSTLDAGVISVGSIGFKPADVSKAGGVKALKIEDIEFVDVKGTPIEVASSIE